MVLTKIGLDLGYANITLSDVTAGIYREPSVALVSKDTHRVIAVGDAALSANPDEGSADGMLVRPFKNGLLFDLQLTGGIVENAVKAVLPAEKVRCIVGVPSDFVPKQENVLFSMMSQAGVNECYSVNRAIAALIGAGYSPTMSAVSVNIGAASTEVAVLYGGKILYTSRTPIGGENFDTAVKTHIFEQGDVNVSLSVARAIKEKLGAVWSGKDNESIDIEGTLSLTGSKVRMNITTEDIAGVFEAPLCELFGAVADAIKKIPLDCVEKIFENGIILTGGGSLIYGLDLLMSKILGVSVTKPADAIDSVAKGLSRINAILPIKMRSNNKNITAQLSKYYENKKAGK